MALQDETSPQPDPTEPGSGVARGAAASKRTGAQLIWEALLREGVEVVFGYPGGAIMPAYDAMPRYRDPARAGPARARRGPHGRRLCPRSGKVGVAIATSGPGATNLVTGIATAMLDSSPVVCITGQVTSSLIGSNGFQEVDITSITAADHQTQLLGYESGRGRKDHARGVPHRALGPAGAGAGRHLQGRAAGMCMRRRAAARADLPLAPASGRAQPRIWSALSN